MGLGLRKRATTRLRVRVGVLTDGGVEEHAEVVKFGHIALFGLAIDGAHGRKLVWGVACIGVSATVNR